MKTAGGAAVFEGMKLGEVGSQNIGAHCQRRSHSSE
jgi:chemotaxis receptor (MCP) glutamine deamidase CheD